MIKPYFETTLGKLYNADCLELMKEIPDKSVDLVLTDPPYGTTENAWDVVVSFKKLWEYFYKISKFNCCFILTASQPFTTDLIISNRTDFKYCLVWDKLRPCGSMLSNIRPLKYHEDICIFYRKLSIYNPQKVRGPLQKKASGGKSENYNINADIKRYQSDEYYPESVLRFPSCHNMTGKSHPTEKPISLMNYLIKTYSNANNSILDPFLGSGTTAVACEQLGRRWIGIEISEKYCEIAAKRIANEAAQGKMF